MAYISLIIALAICAVKARMLPYKPGMLLARQGRRDYHDAMRFRV